MGRGKQLLVAEIFCAYKETGAKLEVQEKVKGQLAKGYIAYFVLLSEHREEVASEAFKDSEVLKTWIKGNKVFLIVNCFLKPLIKRGFFIH